LAGAGLAGAALAGCGSSSAYRSVGATHTVAALRSGDAPGKSGGPARGPVLEVGDSLGIDLGWGLQAALVGSGHEFIGAAVGDTGLAEPSYYNWPGHLAAEVAEYHPGVVVVFLGANDVENLYVGGRLDAFGSGAWASAYGQRVRQMMGEVIVAGARALWVGMPPMADPTFSSDMATLNAVYRSEAARWGRRVAYFSAWDVLGGPHGRFEAGAPGAGGGAAPWRTADGIHITRAGADVLAKAVVAELREKGWLTKK
jgi:hypothetical protein